MVQNAKGLPISLEKKSNQSSVSTNKLTEDLGITEYLRVADEKTKPIPIDGGFGIWNFVNFYIRKGMPYLEQLQEKHKSSVFKLKLGATYYTVINDFKAIEVTYDLTKVEKLPHFGSFSLNWTMVKNFQPSAVCNGYDHELKKAALMQYNNHCMKGLNINRFVESVHQSFLKLKGIPNDSEGFLIEEYLEKAITETYVEVMLAAPIDYDLLQKWKKRALLLRGFPRFIRQIGEEQIANELFESFKASPFVQKIREFIKSPLDDECLLSQLVWTLTFNGWAPLCTFVISELCCFLRLSEADQSLLRKEAAEFLQSEEKSFELLDNLHYINQFYLEAHRLFHPPATNYSVAVKDFILDSSSGYFQIKRGDLLIGNRQAAQRDPSLFEQPANFSLYRDIELYEKYVKSFGGRFSQAADIRNHKCTSQTISTYISKIFLVFITKCDNEVRSSLAYQGLSVIPVKAYDEPVAVTKFIYQS